MLPDAAARNTLLSVFAIWLVSNPLIQFTLYELLKRRMLGQGITFFCSDNLTAGKTFIIGAISNAIAAVTTFVHRLLPYTKLSSYLSAFPRPDQPAHQHGRLHAASRHRHHQAQRAAGCPAKMAQTILTAAFTFSFYERIHGAMSDVLMARSIV